MTTFNAYCDKSRHLPNDGQSNSGTKAERITVAGQTAIKAKAAFQRNTASVLLPRLVDELHPSAAQSIACSNSGTEDRSGGEGKS